MGSPTHAVAAQVEIENKIEAVESNLSYFSFKRLIPGAFNVGWIGSTCTALPHVVNLTGPAPAAAAAAVAQGLTLVPMSAQLELLCRPRDPT